LNPSSIARRYAKALFELASEEGKLDEIGAQLERARAALEVDPDLLTALQSPSTTREDRLAVATALATSLAAGATLGSFLKLLADRRRLSQLPAMAQVFRALADERAGRVRAKVTSAVPISDDAAQRLGAALSRATRRNVVVERAVDRSILGGVVAQVGSQLFDGSLLNQLAQLKRQLKA
jgi:F-type H+-transporting ATPase subunit delta